MSKKRMNVRALKISYDDISFFSGRPKQQPQKSNLSLFILSLHDSNEQRGHGVLSGSGCKHGSNQFFLTFKL